MKTEYSQAVDEWKESREYKASLLTLTNKGIKEKYAHNILLCAFEAGWNKRAEINRP
jgi:hypothetical protein